MGHPKSKLADRLLEERLVSPKDLERALALQKERGGSLGRILVQEGILPERELIGIIGREFRIPPIDLAKCVLDPSLKEGFPAAWASQYQAVPVAKIGQTLTVAMADPLNPMILDDLKARTHLEISPLIATSDNIQWALTHYYGVGGQSFVESLVKEMQPKTAAAHPDDTLTPQTPVVKVTGELIREAVKQKASDILVEPLEGEVRVRFRVDGILHEAQRFPKAVHAALVSRIKVVSRLDIAERRLPQDGRFRMRFEERDVDFRVNVIPSVLGEKVAIRILDRGAVNLELDQLGFEGPNLDALRQRVKAPHGMILVCGPTGSGKTTTLYAVLKFIDAPTKNIVTVEDPIELELAGMNQVQVRPEIGLTFAASLRSILRQDPNVILVGEIRDNETVDIAIKAALTGHLVLSTLHTNTAPGAVVRLMNMGVEPFLITSAVLAVASQRLARRLCDRCKAPSALTDAVVRQLGGLAQAAKEEEKRMACFRAVGCPACRQTGYRGRVALIELLQFTPAVRELILRRVPEPEIRRAAVGEGMTDLREDGIRKLRQGLTTVEEVLRVTGGRDGASP